MILVTGATGQLGTSVVETLLRETEPSRIAAFVRDENKARAFQEKGVDVRVGDYDDADALGEAMQGVEKVLLIAGTDEENRLRQHQNVVDAAKKAGVACVAYSSRTLKNRATLVNQLMLGHFQTEDYLMASGLNYVIFRNVLYLDTLPQFVGGDRVFETGIRLPTGDGRVPFALRSEMGEAIARALLQPCDNRVYHLTGAETYSFTDVAAALSELSGKAVAYLPVEKSAFEAQLTQRGLPEVMVERITGFLTDIKNGQEDEIHPDLETLLGRKPAALKDGLKILFGL